MTQTINYYIWREVVSVYIPPFYPSKIIIIIGREVYTLQNLRKIVLN